MFRIVISTAIVVTGLLTGCSNTQKAPTVDGNIRTSLQQGGFKDVSVTQDRDKGVVTLGGHVATDADKASVNQIAQSLATGQVVANQVEVLPASDAGPAKAVYADLDKGIDNNLDAALISGGYKTGIGHTAKNGVVTLTGTVDTATQRTQIDTIAQGVPNTQQTSGERDSDAAPEGYQLELM